MRLDLLARDIKKILPDVILLQEVGAGAPNSKKDCADFNEYSGADKPWENTAWRLIYRLMQSNYSGGVVCRGNLGWVTNELSF